MSLSLNNAYVILVNRLNGPLAKLEYVLPTTDEVSTLEDEDVTDFLDLAEYYLMGRLLGEIDDVDERLGPHGKWRSQYPERLRKQHIELGNKLDKRLGLSSARIELGTVEVKWMEEDDS